jgi:hypothetical protein
LLWACSILLVSAASAVEYRHALKRRAREDQQHDPAT